MLSGSFLAVFGFSMMVGFGAVVSPGPLSTAVVSQAPRYGWRVGPLVVSGHVLMELVIVLMISFGLSSWLEVPVVYFLIAFLGGILLLWMGAGMLIAAWRRKHWIEQGDDETDLAMSGGRMVMLGILTTLSSPFWYAWWMTVAAGYLVQARALGVVSVAAFFGGHAVADFAWVSFLAFVVGSGRRWITDNVYRAIVAACGAFFVYLGVVFVQQGLAARVLIF